MDLKKQVATACVLSNAVEVASGILRRLDGNDISSSQDGPRDVESDVAVELNARLTGGVSAMQTSVAQEASNVA